MTTRRKAKCDDRMSLTYRQKRHANGLLLVDRGCVHGFPMTFNLGDERFYVHAPGSPGVSDGTEVLATFREWRSAVQFAPRRSLAQRAKGVRR